MPGQVHLWILQFHQILALPVDILQQMNLPQVIKLIKMLEELQMIFFQHHNFTPLIKVILTFTNCYLNYLVPSESSPFIKGPTLKSFYIMQLEPMMYGPLKHLLYRKQMKLHNDTTIWKLQYVAT